MSSPLSSYLSSLSGLPSTPQPVTIVRPKMSFGAALAVLILTPLLSALVVSWLAPIATGGAFAPGFWQSMAIWYIGRTLFGDTSYSFWTKAHSERR